MKDYRIQSWTVREDMPNQTEVSVAVLYDVGGIKKADMYEMVLNTRFDNLTDEFKQAVEGKLTTLRLI